MSKQFILLDQFKEILPEGVATYFNEQQLLKKKKKKIASEAVVLAHKHIVTHKLNTVETRAADLDYFIHYSRDQIR